MIQCDHCKEWYHGSCVNVTPTDALDIDSYICVLNAGIGRGGID